MRLWILPFLLVDLMRKGSTTRREGEEEEMRARQAPYNCDSKSIDKKGLVASRSVCVCFIVHTIV